MPDYEHRLYRLAHSVGAGRHCFTARYRKTDLWIAVDSDHYAVAMRAQVIALVSSLWEQLTRYIDHNPDFVESLVPCRVQSDAPDIAVEMLQASQSAGIGPMSAVAGAFARRVGEMLIERFGCREVIVENGGDIYLKTVKDTDIAIFAGQSPLSEKVGLHIPAELTPLGVCTSSGTVGPSLSLGRADAVAVVCSDTALADSLATAFCNMVQRKEQVGKVAQRLAQRAETIGTLVVKDDNMAVAGRLELRLFGE